MQTRDFQFVFLGSNLAVDFVNTEILNRRRLIDLLQNSADLTYWAAGAGFQLNGRLNVNELAAAKKLRQALKDVFHARIDKRPPKRSSVAVINRHLARYASHKALQVKENDYVLVPDKDASGISAFLARLAYEGAMLLVSQQAARLKRCSNTDCILIFVDTSRGRKRRWCSMDTCGNRAKVAKHYRSHMSQ